MNDPGEENDFICPNCGGKVISTTAHMSPVDPYPASKLIATQ
jgi:rRNA maturation protein Nop10